MTRNASSSLSIRLSENNVRKEFLAHDFFRRVEVAPLTREHAAIFLGQWWHPLHYFPTFLARCISVFPDIAAKCAVARILNQETGEGKPARAHEVIFADTMARAGFDAIHVVGAAPFEETKQLVAGYQEASAAECSALGFIFATEVADLVMVSSLGTAVRRVTGVRELEWVDIHMRQEPDHVQEADHSLLRDFRANEESLIVSSAETMWRLWGRFFDRLRGEVLAPAPSITALSA